MRPITAALAAMVILSCPTSSHAQSPQSSPPVSVPRLIHIGGVFSPKVGTPAPVEVVTLAIYADETGGTPLWQETQNVDVDPSGRYALMLGATEAEGVPVNVFATGEARWLGIAWARPGEGDAPRTRLTFVPYALSASNAETLGGKPASAYVLAPAVTSGPDKASQSSIEPAVVNSGTPGTLAKYVNTTDLGSSAVFEASGFVGINTTNPFDVVHATFLNTTGSITGYAVQNLGSTAASYSGMLFYDHTGALGQFQGFNNSTHEYRINNVARNAMSAFNGSINFMIGSSSKFFVGPGGNVGIGTASPIASLEVNNSSSANVTSNVIAVSYTGTNTNGSLFAGRKFRGTLAAPTAVVNGDALVTFRGTGYTGTTVGTGGASIQMRAAENWTDTAQGAAIHFFTTPNATATTVQQMTLSASGNLGIGTTNPNNALEISRNGESIVTASSFGGGDPGFAALKARGTIQTPAAVQAGDVLGFFAAGGYDGTDVGLGGGIGAFAMENWTSTAHGSATALFATPLGSLEPVAYVAIQPDGKVGIDMPLDVNGNPTPALDTLQVFGDIRVGTSGVNGCLKNFAGTGLIGVCSSDRRLKKNITPFGKTLEPLTALQPVHYSWRAAEFPDRHFGASRAYGLVAQDVEQVLPELVVTSEDGYKAVDYTKLPLLTIQAVKELKAENDDLKQRVTELERLVKELISARR